MSENEKVKELRLVGKELGIIVNTVPEKPAVEYLNFVIGKFKPKKVSGHLSIYNNSIEIPLEKVEFTYCNHLNSEPVYIFFDQENADKNLLVEVIDGQKVCTLMQKSFGMEYFLSNKNADFLIAVNWYVVEFAGLAKTWIFPN